MSSEDAESQPGHQPPDDAPPPRADQPSDAGDSLGGVTWSDDFVDAFADQATTNLFSEEIENVNASDWDVDTASIWGDDGEIAAAEDGGAMGLDLPL